MVDQEGVLLKNKVLETVLFEDDNPHRSYVQKMKRDLINTLKELKIADILSHTLIMGEIGIAKERVKCDYYDWLDGDPEAVKAFNGEYMEEYSWAEAMKARIMRIGDYN